MNIQWTTEHTTVKTNLFGFVMYLTLNNEVFYKRPSLCIYTSDKTQAEYKNSPFHRSTVSVRILNCICEKPLIFQLIPVWVLEQNSTKVNRVGVYWVGFYCELLQIFDALKRLKPNFTGTLKTISAEFSTYSGNSEMQSALGPWCFQRLQEPLFPL